MFFIHVEFTVAACTKLNLSKYYNKMLIVKYKFLNRAFFTVNTWVPCPSSLTDSSTETTPVIGL